MQITVKSSSTKMGKGCGTLFFGIFAVMGLILFGVLCKLTWDTAREYSWKETDCTILSSQLETGGKKYALAISYAYEFEGRAFTGTRLRSSGNSFDKAREAQRAIARYAGDTRAKCFVNPSTPAESVLERGSLWIALTVLFPLIFVAIGVGGIVAVWRGASAKKKPVSERARKAKGGGALVARIIGVLFTIIGGVALYFVTFKSLGEVRESQGWRETPCVITSSGIESHSGSKGGTTYSLDIRYRYSVDGRAYVGDRYNFSASSSSNRGWREEVVRKYPPGLRTVCFVAPDDPLNCVLVRETGGVEWFGIVPGIFLVLGVGLLLGAGRLAKSKPGTALARAGLRTGEAAKLKPAGTPLGGCIAIGIFAAIWNGVVWGFLLAAKMDTGAKIFLALFALAGLGLLGKAIHKFLALFNPLPELTVHGGEVQLGGTVELDFRMTGSVKRITHLRITLEGREAATYRRGTDTVTDKSVFAAVPVLDTRDHAAMSSGTLRAVVPAELMHSFDAPNNKIIWTLHVRGEIPKWPDVDTEYPLTVLPAGRAINDE